MRKLHRTFLITLCVYSISACSWVLPQEEKFFPREPDYTRSVNRPTLMVPPPLNRAKFSNDYSIEPVLGQVGVSMLPPGSQLAKTANKIKLDKQG